MRNGWQWTEYADRGDSWLLTAKTAVLATCRTSACKKGQTVAGGPRGGCAVQMNDAGRVVKDAPAMTRKVGAGDTASEALVSSKGALATHNLQQSWVLLLLAGASGLFVA